MKVPVILLNYNCSADCCKCVADLKQQEGAELEIIIVDNCSRKEDALAVEQLATEQGCTFIAAKKNRGYNCLLYTSPSPRDQVLSRMPSSA